jgi:hypothetical protein
MRQKWGYLMLIEAEEKFSALNACECIHGSGLYLETLKAVGIWNLFSAPDNWSFREKTIFLAADWCRNSLPAPTISHYRQTAVRLNNLSIKNNHKECVAAVRISASLAENSYSWTAAFCAGAQNALALIGICVEHFDEARKWLLTEA